MKSSRTILALLSLVLAPLLAACGVLDSVSSVTGGGSGERANEGRLQVEEERTIVRIVGVEYSSTSTVIQLEIERPFGEMARLGYYYRPVFDEELTLQGFAAVDRVDQRSSGGSLDAFDWREFRLGPVLDVTQPVVFEIGQLCSVEPPGECVQGPWRFEWVPGHAALDPISVVVPVNQTLSAHGLTVHIEEVRLSSRELVMTLWSEGQSSRGGPSGVPELRLPDGTRLHGQGGGGSSAEAPRSLKTWRFEPLPDGVKEFWVEFGPDMLSIHRPTTFEFSLPHRLGGLDLYSRNPANLTIGVEIEVDGEVLRLSHVQVQDGKLGFVVDNVTDGPRTLQFGGLGGMAHLTDALGNTYSPYHAFGGYQGQTGFVYNRVNLDALEHMTLTTGTMGIRIEAPGPFHIVLP